MKITKTQLREAAKGLQGFKKHLGRTKGKLLFYAESPDGKVYMGLAQMKNKKFVLGVGTPFPPSGASISAPEIGDTYSSLSQAKAGIKDQMYFAKKGYSHPDEKKFSWNVVVDKLNESVNESRVSVAKEGKLEPFAKAAIKQLQNLISFHKKGKNEKARQMSRDVYTELEYMGMAFRVLGESINEGKYHDYRNDDTLTAKQKIGRSMREVRDSLCQLEGLVKMNVKLKNELNVDSRSYWKNTHKALHKISERLVKLANKVGQLQ